MSDTHTHTQNFQRTYAITSTGWSFRDCPAPKRPLTLLPSRTVADRCSVPVRDRVETASDTPVRVEYMEGLRRMPAGRPMDTARNRHNIKQIHTCQPQPAPWALHETDNRLAGRPMDTARNTRDQHRQVHPQHRYTNTCHTGFRALFVVCEQTQHKTDSYRPGSAQPMDTPWSRQEGHWSDCASLIKEL